MSALFCRLHGTVHARATPWGQAVGALGAATDRAGGRYVFYESGLSINVVHTVDDPKERAVGFKLSDGMEAPPELATRFKFARQKSRLAGTIRGSYFAFKNDY